MSCRFALVFSCALGFGLTGCNPDRPGEQGAALDAEGSDQRITRDVKRAVSGVEASSGHAEMVKVVSEDGVVTLLGPVHSGEEKALIGALTQNVPGVRLVHNQLEIIAGR